MTKAEDEWARVRPWIKEAVATNEFFSIEYVEEGIACGRMTLWAGKYGAVVTEVLEYPNGSALNVFGGGGAEHEALKEFTETLDPILVHFAKANGCKWITVTGREGWQRVGKSLGYRPAWTVIAKEII